MIHCPESFKTLSIEEAETGELITIKESDHMEFHSRLAVSSDGRYLLDAGWFWHPIGGAWVFDLAELMDKPADSVSEWACSFGAEIESAAFLGNEEIVLTSNADVINEDIPDKGIGPMKVGVWSMVIGNWRSQSDLSEPSGAIMPWRDWMIAFHECPKVIELATGKIIHRWNGIYSGKQRGSIELGEPPPPPMAFDPENGRFAVAGPKGISVVTLS